MILSLVSYLKLIEVSAKVFVFTDPFIKSRFGNVVLSYNLCFCLGVGLHHFKNERDDLFGVDILSKFRKRGFFHNDLIIVISHRFLWRIEY